MQFTAFRYSQTEAFITAKWQVGVRNYTLPLGVAPFAVVLLWLLLSRIEALRLEGPTLGVPYLCAAALYVMMILYILFRLNLVSRQLLAREVSVSFEGHCVTVKTGENAVYITRNEDITRIDFGPHILRILSPFGGYCIPIRLVPPAFQDEMMARDGLVIRRRRWM